MCTVSIIGLPHGGYRLVHSRDELRSRGRAVIPAWRDLGGGIRVMCPTDPDAGGTWIAMREDGTTTAVTNVNIPDNGRAEPTKSRGEIPLILARCEDQAARLGSLRGTDLSVYTPFTAYGVEVGAGAGDADVFYARWDGLELTVLRESGGPFSPVCVASSGLGDEIVQCRVPLFDEMVRPDPSPVLQDDFHAHQWEDRPERSVLMSRENARTVSVTTVEAARGMDPVMRYRELSEGVPEHDPVGAALLQ